MSARGERVAVVTGANRGIGFEVSRQLARRGHRVVLTGRREEAVEEAVARLHEQGHEAVEGQVMDVSSDGSVIELFEWLDQAHSRVDVLVNNAGAIFEGAGQEDPAAAHPLRVAPEVLRQAFETNTIGAYRTMQQAIPRMNEAGFGRVVNVTSGMGSQAGMGAGWPAYRTSKAALNALTQIFAHEAGPQVKVNAVCPGWVRTEMGGPGATRSVEGGAAGVIWAATLEASGPSGGLFRDGEPIDW